jgi:hypothetical protein
MRRCKTLMIVAMLSLATSAALAAPSCTCSKQTDGTSFCTCVDDKGVTYCMSCPANGGACSKVACK